MKPVISVRSGYSAFSMCEIDDGFTAFWSVTVNPGTIQKVTVPGEMDATLTNAGLNITDPSLASGNVVLYVKVNEGTPVALFPFIVGKFESATTDLMFGEGHVMEFWTEGDAIPVHLNGYLNGGFALENEEVAK